MLRTHRSGNVYISAAPPPPPPARVPAANALTKQNYVLDLTDDKIPTGLALKQITRCHLEYIDVRASNDGGLQVFDHTLLRFTFRHQLQNDTPYAPEQTRGVIIDLRALDEDQPAATGIVNMGTFVYDGPHRDAVRVEEIPLSGRRTVGDLVKIIQKSGLSPCSFETTAGGMVGCRDFTKRFVRLPAGTATTIYNSFNSRYHLTQAPVAYPVAYALFERAYRSEVINQINYVGTRLFLN
ncbi:unnamed protein product [Penicillium glandicola]